MSVSYNGRLLATGGRDGNVIVSRIPTLPKEGFAVGTGNSEPVRRLFFFSRRSKQGLARKRLE